MSRRFLSRLCLSALLVCCFSGQAEPLANMQAIGQAKLKVLFWNVYRSTLYSQDGRYIESQLPLALKIHYLRDINAKDLVEKTADEWRKLGLPSSQTQAWLTRLELVWPNIKKGDELLLVVNEDRSSTFYFNKIPLENITDLQFGSNFLRIWLDKNSSYPELRKQLIGDPK
ncbi:MAG: hypothetical protein ACI9C4_000703 [Paraglaciecola sp.]|jgi:hypothetical protein